MKPILLVLALALVTAAMMAVMASPVFAKITPVDVSCTNQGGNLPTGQQPTCQGSGLEQQTENQNPAGHAPPGQNP